MLDENLFIRSLAPPEASEPADYPTDLRSNGLGQLGHLHQLLTDYASPHRRTAPERRT